MILINDALQTGSGVSRAHDEDVSSLQSYDEPHRARKDPRAGGELNWMCPLSVL